MKKTLLLILVIFVFETINAQKDFIHGYYITINNDTIKAQIKLGENSNKITVIESNSEKKKLSPKEVKAFSYLGITNYKAIANGGKKPNYFAEVMEEGDLILYRIGELGTQQDKGFHVHIISYAVQKKNDDTSLKLFYSHIPFTFKKDIKTLIKDDSSLLGKIDTEELGIKDIPIIVNMYNKNKGK